MTLNYVLVCYVTLCHISFYSMNLYYMVVVAFYCILFLTLGLVLSHSGASRCAGQASLMWVRHPSRASIIQHVKANLPPSSGADDHLNGIVADVWRYWWQCIGDAHIGWGPRPDWTRLGQANFAGLAQATTYWSEWLESLTSRLSISNAGWQIVKLAPKSAARMALLGALLDELEDSKSRDKWWYETQCDNMEH